MSTIIPEESSGGETSIVTTEFVPVSALEREKEKDKDKDKDKEKKKETDKDIRMACLADGIPRRDKGKRRRKTIHQPTIICVSTSAKCPLYQINMKFTGMGI